MPANFRLADLSPLQHPRYDTRPCLIAHRTNPGPLAVYLAPVGVDAFGVTFRLKYAALGTNVFSNLSAFLKFHLREPSHAAFISVIKNWMALDEAERNHSGNVVWSPTDLCAKCVDRTTSSGAHVEDSLDFLLTMEDDPMDRAEGTLHLDVNMASVRDIDDGATVAGALDELREAQEGLATALEQNDQLQDANVQLQAQLAAQKADLEKVRRAFAAAQASQPLPPTIAPPPPTGANPSGSATQDTTTNLGPITECGGGSSTPEP